MFDRIIVPLDGSRFAAAALEPACELASLFHSSILVTRAIRPFGELVPPFASDGPAEFQLEQVSEADAYLREVVQRLCDRGYDADFTLYIGEAGAGISHVAELRHADMIVMNMRLRQEVDPQCRDSASVTLRVLRRTRTPILSYHLDASQSADAALGPQRDSDIGLPPRVRRDAPIVVPLDGSVCAEQALPVAEALARVMNTQLVLVHAIPGTGASPSGVSAVDADHLILVGERAADEYLTGVRAKVEAHDLVVTTCVAVGTPLEVIAHVWREHRAGLIVLASHGSDGHHGTLFGSVAATVLAELEAPTLVIQPEGVPMHEWGGTVAHSARRDPSSLLPLPYVGNG